MDVQSLDTLEYKSIIAKLGSLAESSIAREKIAELTPVSDIATIEGWQRDTADALKILNRQGRPPLFGINDLSQELSRVAIGGALSPGGLLRVCDSLRVARHLKDFLLVDEEDEENRIRQMIGELESYPGIEREIEGAIISETEIDDNASRALYNIRRSMKNKTDAIRQKLNSIIQTDATRQRLQDNIITIREGRYVVPVKAENKRSFSGVVHDQSSSGQTVYIEPMAVVELNNDLRVLEGQEQEEIHRILLNLSQLIAANAEMIKHNQSLLTEVDFVFAKAKLAAEQSGTKPVLNDKGIIVLKSARHPLLVGKVVPIDVVLGETFNTLVITGPNTGGKTVSLKTVGLMTVMAQSGLHIPCEENSVVAVFNDVFTDIGDRQSIEQSLSTFSSSMTNIVRILSSVTENALVLFDELGAGTDPTEGAALAMAILNVFLERGIRTLATTHYSQLKLYALSTAGVQNAAVEFDVDTLSPTYRLMIGAPGKSNAFEISSRLGLSKGIIDRANETISKENQDFEDVLQKLESDRLQMEANKIEIERYKMEIEGLKRNLNMELEKTERAKDRILDKAKEEAREILKEARTSSEALIKDIKQVQGLGQSDRDRELMKISNRMKKQWDKVGGEYSFLNKEADTAPDEIRLGDNVEVLAMGQVGQVLTLPDKNGDLQIQLGILKISANVKNVKKTASVEEETSQKNIKKIIADKAAGDIEREVDLRGKNIEEGIFELEKFIDDAILVGLEEIFVIHGKGTGALREGITQYLKRHRAIKSIRFGSISEGGNGVTVAKLK